MTELCYNKLRSAGVAHPVERHLAKVEVASSSLVTRSNFIFESIRLEESNETIRGIVSQRVGPRWLLDFRKKMQTSLVTRSNKVK